MTLFIEILALCAAFTVMVYVMSRDPIKTVYNYPPKIQERVSSLDMYKDKIPTQENKIITKLTACVIFTIVCALILRYVNGCKTFTEALKTGFILWTCVNLYDVVIMDIIWFCHDPHFVLPGTEDMVEDYHDYLFHIKGGFIGELIGMAVCVLASLIVPFLP
ncbi:MAG: hypothetical protein IK151_09645 [Erysipelotrichaceae bacterium]|nr:hypothetical protein [Erysipelotrichaceae bacterium]